jgi:DNA-binding GntR family transcriptional regulator
MPSPTASTHRIKRQSIPETLTASLRERILNGEFKEGDPLVQDTIAQEYDTSRMPVREALRQLEAEGLVIMQLHKGAVVTSLPTEQIEELFELRALLECEVLRIAIPRLTDEHLADARTILKELEGAYQRRDISSWGRLNWDFHLTLYRPAGRVQTLTILQGINLQTDRYIRLHLLLTRAIAQAEKEHRELLLLCRAREVERAVAFLKEHILGTRAALLAAIQKSRMREAGS